MSDTTKIDIDKRYKELREKAEKANVAVMSSICRAIKENPDKLRDAIGSVAFRKAEEYCSYEEQADALFVEWLFSKES